MPFENNYLIDGGIRENVPWKELKENGADKVISVVFQNEIEEKQKINIIDSISGSIEILCHELSNYELFGARKIEKIIKNNIENIIIDKIINNIHDITISSILIKE